MAFIDLTCVLSRSRRRTASSTAVIRPGLVGGGKEKEATNQFRRMGSTVR